MPTLQDEIQALAARFAVEVASLVERRVMEAVSRPQESARDVLAYPKPKLPPSIDAPPPLQPGTWRLSATARGRPPGWVMALPEVKQKGAKNKGDLLKHFPEDHMFRMK